MNAPKSIAVFLGPSVDRRRAAELVDASIYPPARMGDGYRLIASGVRIIVLVDVLTVRMRGNSPANQAVKCQTAWRGSTDRSWESSHSDNG